MSIHPIDYLTLSHNNSGWSSCLSWDGGMYAGGTLEALNSNMCVVCYLLNESKSFTTIQNKYPIPNKAWRCMFFVHKNIILSGNPYPFDNKQLVLEGLDWAYELAYNNMHWDYKYKKQEYKDMLHRTNNEYTRHNVCELTCCSKNIIVYTYGLYNDFCYPENTFYCYRNPVYKLLRLSLGGRGTCLMCGKKLENINKDYFLQSDRTMRQDSIIEITCAKNVTTMLIYVEQEILYMRKIAIPFKLMNNEWNDRPDIEFNIPYDDSRDKELEKFLDFIDLYPNTRINLEFKNEINFQHLKIINKASDNIYVRLGANQLLQMKSLSENGYKFF